MLSINCRVNSPSFRSYLEKLKTLCFPSTISVGNRSFHNYFRIEKCYQLTLQFEISAVTAFAFCYTESIVNTWTKTIHRTSC